MGLPHETMGKEKGSNYIKIKKVVPISIKGTTFLYNRYYLFIESVPVIVGITGTDSCNHWH